MPFLFCINIIIYQIIKKGDIITFEQPKVLFTKETADQNNAKAIYDDSKHSTLYNFFYY